MSQNSKQSHVKILSGEYEGTPMRITLPTELESLLVDMQQALYDYDFLQKGLLPETTSYYRNPGKKWINKRLVLVYMLLKQKHWLEQCVLHQKETNRKLREKIQNQ